MLPDYPIIDAHVHIQPWEMVKPGALAALRTRRQSGMGDPLAYMDPEHGPERLIAYMDANGIEKVGIVNYVAPEVMGFREKGVNEFSAAYAAAAPERIIPFGSIDPRDPVDADQRMEYILGQLAIKVVKIHPPHQLVHANAYRDRGGIETLATIYATAQAYHVPVMIHTGTSVFPGARNKYADPMALDDVALDFPDLQIILAHGGRPIWMETAYFLLRRHKNMWLDISSVPPTRLLDYFPWLPRVAEKAIFGSDWPGPGVPGIRENVEAFMDVPLDAEIKRLILRENALRLFGEP
ncbi:MAG: amidohydrolase family protein [Ardenticatenaceae bacterium]|nr:amidohydrolase family protein [Ardenticatenaceae bacterium]